MSDIGGINFGPQEDPISQMVNSIKNLEDKKIKTKYTWVELLNMLKKGVITPPLYITDPNGYVYEYNFECGNFLNEDDEALTSNYNDIDLITLELTILDNPKGKNTTKEDILDVQAKNKLREKLEFNYMDLDMSIDNCQGCMDGLDEAFAELRILADTIKFLGGDVEKDHSRIYDNWANIRRQETAKEEQIKQEKDKIIEPLALPIWKLATMQDEQLGSYIMDIVMKINEICNKFRDTVDKEEKL